MNSEPSEYKSDKKENSILPSINPLSFSVSWVNMPNMQGVKPPNPQFQSAPAIPYILSHTVLPTTHENGKTPVGLIQSNREPYAVEWYWGQYGSLQSKLGTNLGA